jgi:PIN domain nuclease of toxin-antitoxin system
MRVLLDTATFLWVVLSPSRLSTVATRLYEDPLNEVYLSAASVYEIVVKVMLGKLDVGGSPSEFIRNERESRGILPLPIDEDAAFAVERLPAIHADPFDRLLIAQSIASEMTLLTPDAVIARYPIRVAW